MRKGKIVERILEKQSQDSVCERETREPSRIAGRRKKRTKKNSEENISRQVSKKKQNVGKRKRGGI